MYVLSCVSAGSGYPAEWRECKTQDSGARASTQGKPVLIDDSAILLTIFEKQFL